MATINWRMTVKDGTLEDWLRGRYPQVGNAELLDELAAILGSRPPLSTVAVKAWRMGLHKDPPHREPAPIQVPESPYTRWTDPPRIPQPALCLFDVHAPYHHAGWLKQVTGLAAAWGVRQLVLGGDFADLAAFSPFGRDAEVYAEKEFREVEAVLDGLAAGFDQVTYIWGNHSERIRRLVGKDLAASRFLRLFSRRENVAISEYWWGFCGERWIVCHPGNASVIHARVPSLLAEKYNRHVAAGHGHLQGAAWTRSGELIGLDVGVCADRERLEYTQRRLNTRPAVNLGALILVDELPWLLTPLSDFKRLARLGPIMGPAREEGETPRAGGPV